MAQETTDNQSLLEKYQPMILTRGKKNAILVVGPQYLLIHNSQHDLARSLLAEQGLGHLFSKKRKLPSEPGEYVGVYVFNIGDIPKEDYERLKNLDMIDDVSKRKVDNFNTNMTTISEKDVRWKMTEEDKKHLEHLTRKRAYSPNYRTPLAHML